MRRHGGSRHLPASLQQLEDCEVRHLTTTGTENLVCNRCGTILDTRTTAKLAHVDKNHDNKCDVCGKNLSTTVPSVTPSTPVKSGNTADNSNMGLWVVLMSLSLFGSVTLLRSKKRRA